MSAAWRAEPNRWLLLWICTVMVRDCKMAYDSAIVTDNSASTISTVMPRRGARRGRHDRRIGPRRARSHGVLTIGIVVIDLIHNSARPSQETAKPAGPDCR